MSSQSQVLESAIRQIRQEHFLRIMLSFLSRGLTAFVLAVAVGFVSQNGYLSHEIRDFLLFVSSLLWLYAWGLLLVLGLGVVLNWRAYRRGEGEFLINQNTPNFLLELCYYLQRRSFVIHFNEGKKNELLFTRLRLLFGELAGFERLLDMLNRHDKPSFTWHTDEINEDLGKLSTALNEAVLQGNLILSEFDEALTRIKVSLCAPIYAKYPENEMAHLRVVVNSICAHFSVVETAFCDNPEPTVSQKLDSVAVRLYRLRHRLKNARRR